MEEIEKQFENYYNLKQSYELFIKNKIDKIIQDNSLSKSDKHKKYKDVLAKIKVKKIFSNENRKLSIIENGNKVIEYDNEYYNLYETSADFFKQLDKKNKIDIMRLKLDVLFNYIDEENSMTEFELLKKEIKEDLTEYSKIVAEIYAIENMNKQSIEDEKEKLYGNVEKNTKGYINDFKEKINNQQDQYIKEAVEIYKSSILPTTQEISKLQYEKGYREIIEEEGENKDTIYHFIKQPFSIKSKEYSSELDEEDIMAKIANKSETKRKLTESELDNEHEKMATLTEELGTLMYEYSTLQRQFNDTTEVQEKIDEKLKELNKHRTDLNIKTLKTRWDDVKVDNDFYSKYHGKEVSVKIPEEYGPYEKQLYIHNLSNSIRQQYIENMTPEELEMYVENLKQRGPDQIEKNYDKERETMNERDFRVFLVKDLMKTKNITRNQAKEIVFFLKAYEDYYKYNYNYDVEQKDVKRLDSRAKTIRKEIDDMTSRLRFTNKSSNKVSKKQIAYELEQEAARLRKELDETEKEKVALDLKNQIEKTHEEQKKRNLNRDKIKFNRNGQLPPWGNATMYKDKLSIGMDVYLTKPKTTFYKKEESGSSSEMKEVKDYINKTFRIKEIKTWDKPDIPGQDRDQALIYSYSMDLNLEGWVNLKDIYVDINPNINEELKSEVILGASDDEKPQEVEVEVEDLPDLIDISKDIKPLDLSPNISLESKNDDDDDDNYNIGD